MRRPLFVICLLSVATLMLGRAQSPQLSKPMFEPIQPDLFAGGANLPNAFADIDNDGDLDLFVGFDGAPNRLYRNEKGSFTNIAATAGVADARATRASAWGDYDADGDPDLLLGFTPGAAGPVPRLYRNDSSAGAPKFSGVTTASGLVVATADARRRRGSRTATGLASAKRSRQMTQRDAQQTSLE
jgi:FG-GAP-like repeat